MTSFSIFEIENYVNSNYCDKKRESFILFFQKFKAEINQ